MQNLFQQIHLMKIKNIGRVFVVLVAGAALIVAANSSQAIVMLGGLGCCIWLPNVSSVNWYMLL